MGSLELHAHIQHLKNWSKLQTMKNCYNTHIYNRDLLFLRCNILCDASLSITKQIRLLIYSNNNDDLMEEI